jgi:hypothetical protein
VVGNSEADELLPDVDLGGPANCLEILLDKGKRCITPLECLDVMY